MTTLGKYNVIGPLGSGGMSEIQLARSPDGTLVVLKRQIMPDDDPYLIDEGNLGLRLSHPGLVETHELFYDGGRPVLSLGYVPGVSLAALLSTGPLSPASVCDLGAQIAEALDALHRATDPRGNPLNIIHRDVTPMNILIGFDGHARLIDLGIARFVNSQAPRTKIGDLRGTLHYLAPEVVNGGVHSKASDLWSLGVSLFEAAMGRVAIERDDIVSVLDAITNQRVLALRPGEVLDVRVRHALAQLVNPEPRCRPAFAGDAAAILGIHAAEHTDATQETIDRVAALLGQPAKTHLEAAADDAAKTAVLTQAELLFGATHDQSDASDAPPGGTLDDQRPPAQRPPASSLDLDDMTAKDSTYKTDFDPFAVAAAEFADPEKTTPLVNEYPELDVDDDDKTGAARVGGVSPAGANPSSFVPEPISILDEIAISDEDDDNVTAPDPAPTTSGSAVDAFNPFSADPSPDAASPRPVSALHQNIGSTGAAPRAEDKLPSRSPPQNMFEDEATLAAHPLVLEDLAKKSVLIRSTEQPSVIGGPDVGSDAGAYRKAEAAPSDDASASALPAEAPLDPRTPSPDETIPLTESPSNANWDVKDAVIDVERHESFSVGPTSHDETSDSGQSNRSPKAAVAQQLVPEPSTVPSGPVSRASAPVRAATPSPFDVPAGPAPQPPAAVSTEKIESIAVPDAPVKRTTTIPWAAIGAVVGVAVVAFVIGYILAQLG